MQNDAKNTDEYLANLPAWQQAHLSLFRRLVHEAMPNVEEVIKWGVPIFMQGKQMVFGMSAFKEHTKYNFILNGAQLKDDDHLFNNGLESKKARSIDRREGQEIDEAKLRSLIEQSVSLCS